MSKFLSIISGAMHRLGLCPDSGRIIVALSGGADSVALLSALCGLGYKCVAAHCDFHLRGDESERDRQHAKAIAESSGADYEEIHFDVEAYRQEHQISVEMACRDLRYEWFHKLSERYGNIPVAVAHHHNDNVETLFLNLFRGTGISGLTGMRPRNGIIIRPMLDTTRAQAEEYLRDRGIRFIIDSSNLVNDVKRNRIRNIVIPAIMEQFADADKGLTSTMDNLRRTADLYRDLLEERVARYISPDGMDINVRLLAEENRESPTLLYEILRDKGFNYTQTANIIAALSGDTASGRIFTAPGWRGLLDRGTLHLSKLLAVSEEDLYMQIDLSSDGPCAPGLEVSHISREELTFDRSGQTLYLDASALDGSPEFILRQWHEGDRIAPFGMKGTRLVSDIFSDAKLSVDEKKKARILQRNGVILWVLGLRTSRYFAVTDRSTDIVRIRAVAIN